jgi:uncharacterized membrane protein YkoI
MRPLIATLLPLLTVLWTAMPSAHATAAPGADHCWADWSAAAPIVHRESLRPAKDVRALAQKTSQGQLLNITLCAAQGKYVYRLLFLRSAGTVESVTVDARAPFGR